MAKTGRRIEQGRIGQVDGLGLRPDVVPHPADRADVGRASQHAGRTRCEGRRLVGRAAEAACEDTCPDLGTTCARLVCTNGETAPAARTRPIPSRTSLIERRDPRMPPPRGIVRSRRPGFSPASPRHPQHHLHVAASPGKSGPCGPTRQNRCPVGASMTIHPFHDRRALGLQPRGLRRLIVGLEVQVHPRRLVHGLQRDLRIALFAVDDRVLTPPVQPRLHAQSGRPERHCVRHVVGPAVDDDHADAGAVGHAGIATARRAEARPTGPWQRRAGFSPPSSARGSAWRVTTMRMARPSAPRRGRPASPPPLRHR